jgi:hypothetical protein
MFNRGRRERQWQRFPEDEEFKNRPGALDRRRGYGEQLRQRYSPPRLRRGERGAGYEAMADYDLPDEQANQREWQRYGPFRGAGPRNYRRSDERIHEDVCLRLTQHGQIDASDITVEVNEGEVTLEGTVADRRIKRMVEANTEMIPGVVDVHNRLRLRHRPSQEELRKQRKAEEMAEKFPGGPEPTGPAAILEERQGEDFRPKPG